MKRIAVLTSGGDAPGMNASIRAVVRYGINAGLEVYGIERGYAGLLDNVFVPLNMRSVSDIVQRGGTMLRTARSKEFATPQGLELAIRFLKKREIDGLIVIGGDGSMRGAETLSKAGFPTIGIPGTIDNDLAYTQYTLGFDTACNTVLDAINKLRDTMSSHDRICIIEVMGRNCGDIALQAGLGGGAEIILVPEIPTTYEQISDRLREDRRKGKYSSIIVIAEGAGKAEDLQKRIKDDLGASIRATVLGHLQRGGSPSCRDRYLGTTWGVQAVKLLLEGKSDRVVGIVDEKFVDYDICEALKMERVFDRDLYEMADIVSNSVSVPLISEID